MLGTEVEDAEDTDVVRRCSKPGGMGKLRGEGDGVGGQVVEEQVIEEV